MRIWPGVQRPLRTETPFDFVVVRENTEGEFVQVGSQYLPDAENGMIANKPFDPNGDDYLRSIAVQEAVYNLS